MDFLTFSDFIEIDPALFILIFKKETLRAAELHNKELVKLNRGAAILQRM